MNQDERVIARALFRAKLLQSDGQAYEDLVVAVLERTVPGFRQIKPQGSKGDRKNDGYVRETGCYWQVYAPERPENKGGVAAAKATDDFLGLKAYWQPIAPVREYYFAHNDRYRGSYPDVEEALARIKSEHELRKCEPFLARHLEDLFMTLLAEDMNAIIGMIPRPGEVGHLEYSAVAEVINELMYDTRPVTPDGGIRPPEWDEKIKFNGLSRQVSAFLETSSYQAGSLEEYFRNNSRFLREEVRQRIRAAYLDAVQTAGFVPGNGSGDAVYFMLLESLAPRSESAVRNAAQVIISYYFEACDVFEEPRP